jgi:hypothetical protein
MTRHLIRSVEDIEQYGLPVISNFKIIDAVIQPNILLQFTIAKTHGKLTDNYDEIRNGLKGRKNTHVLIFAIPTENFDSFKPIGVPADLGCYYMHYVPYSPSLLIKRKK